MILLDLIIYAGVYDVTKINDFFTVVGFILFASISCNLLYNYINVRYGKIPIIVYRLVTILYVYFIPITPNVFVFFRSFLRMLYPYIIYLILEYTYSKSNFAVAYKNKRKTIISTTISGILLISLVMLISCKFKYGALVIGSGSMTGSLNKGDAIIYEQYENQNIQEGDIIVFKEKGMQIIHRVVDIKNVNGEYRYFTKGDANQTLDEGYRTKNDIIGITKLRVLYIGYPTIWLRDMFS